jgi:hypothetical protein
MIEISSYTYKDFEETARIRKELLESRQGWTTKQELHGLISNSVR